MGHVEGLNRTWRRNLHLPATNAPPLLTALGFFHLQAEEDELTADEQQQAHNLHQFRFTESWERI